jgi:glutamine amidotransferase
LATRPAVVVASEKMNNDRDWRPLDPGELLHIASNLTVTSSTVLPDGPDHVLTLQDLDPPAASSQAVGGV